MEMSMEGVVSVLGVFQKEKKRRNILYIRLISITMDDNEDMFQMTAICYKGQQYLS